MGPVIVDLDSLSWLNRRLRFTTLVDVVVGVIVIAQFVLTDVVFQIMSLFGALTLIGLPYVFPKVFKPRVVVFDDRGITRPISQRHTVTTSWDQIASAELSDSRFTLVLKAGDPVIINLGNLTMHQYEEAESLIVGYLRTKGVEVQLK